MSRLFLAEAHRGDGRRFIVRADEKLTAFVELESAIHAGAIWFDGRNLRRISKGRKHVPRVAAM
jgi:hypothetical protein